MARRVPLSDPDQVIRALEEDGGVILTGFTSLEDLDAVNSDSAKSSAPPDEKLLYFHSQETTRTTCLYGRSSTAREVWMQRPTFKKVWQYFLQTRSMPYHGDKTEEIVTDPIVSVSMTINTGPGAAAQLLHRDDMSWQIAHADATQTGYSLGRDMCMAVLVPGVETTVENGATVYIPKSHLWPHERRGKQEETIPATMQRGEALLLLGSCVHGGGKNASAAPRPMHSFFLCRSYLRPEENMYPWFTKQEVDKWSPAAKKLAGYVMDGPHLGYTDFADAIDRFRASDPEWVKRET